jgi:phosphoglycolate phosphatase-like HAD superfamily hydrolase
MKLSINDYQTVIFDCDGVILNSNNIKTHAFYDSALIYGDDKANDLAEYHIKNGGISRYKKFDYFLNYIVGCEASKEKVDELLLNFSKKTKHELLKCEIADGIFQLREELSSDWIVISGGNQDEINEVFSYRKIDSLFVEGCIFGSPDPKEVIFDREIKLSKIKYPALFIGDSQYDYEVSREFDVDFIFLSKWTDFSDWKEYTDLHSIKTLSSIKDLLLK